MNKKILIFIALIFVLVSVPIGVYLVGQQQEIRKRAAPATVLSLSPTTISKSPGDNFSLAVMINTGENQVAAVDVTLTFDSAKIVATSVTPGTFLQTVLKSGDISSGSVRFAYANQPAKQGSGTLTTVSFKIQDNAAAGTTKIDFSTSTQVGGVGETGNVLLNTQSATVNISGGGANPTATPTPTPTPTTGGGTGGTSATATPTPTSTSTPTPTGTLTPTPTLPVTGNIETTIGIAGLGILLFILAATFVFF